MQDLANRIRKEADSWTDTGDMHALLAECAEALESQTAEFAALRAAVGELVAIEHDNQCNVHCACGTHLACGQCTCGADAANTARANARKAAGYKD